MTRPAAPPDTPAAEEPSELDAADTTTGGDETDSAATEPEDEPKAERRDRRYRARLREAEQALDAEREQWNTERQQMQQTIEAMQRREIERAAAQRLADPRDVWRHGVQLADLIGQDGAPDPAAIDAAVTDCLAQHPHWATRPPAAAPASLVGCGATKPSTADEADSWTDAFRPRDSA